MSGWRWALGTFVACGLARLSLDAQTTVPLKPFRPDDDKPVLRAEPVQRPVLVPQLPPATSNRVATPIPTVRTAPTPAPSVRTPQVAKPPSNRTTPVPRAAPPRTTPIPLPDVPDPGGEIRLTPQGTMTPDQVQLSFADGYYARKVYDMAAAEYEKYLGLYPNGPDRATALYRLGDSYRRSGTVNAAKNSFETLLNHFTGGEFIGPAAYLLAELYFQEKNYNAALPLFRRASVRLKDPRLTNAAKFFTGRCLEAKGDKREARVAYEDLLSSTEGNPYLDPARLSLALILKESGNNVEALKQIQTLAKQTESPELKARATIYSGLWQIDSKNPAKGAEELKKALQMPEVGALKDVAQLGLLQVLFDTEKYDALIEQYRSGVKDFGPDTRPQAVLLTAKAYRQLKRHKEAALLFEDLIQENPTAPLAKEAMYERLVSLYNAADPNLHLEIDKYLTANPEAGKRDQVLLMKGEALFAKQDFSGAAPIYAMLQSSRTLTGALKGEALSKLGWCHMQSGAHEAAIKTFTALIEGFPAAKTVPAALCQRGLAQLRLKNLPAALKDFDELIKKHSKAKERELALQQKALILGQQSDNQGMAEAFRLLLKDYPETPAAAAAEANYWIGWVEFENKNYKLSIEPLTQARTLDAEQYFDRASLRIMLAHYYLEDKAGVAREIDVFSKHGKGKVPVEVLRWLGKTLYDAGDFEGADKYLTHLTPREEATSSDFLLLGRSRLHLRHFSKATEALDPYLKLVNDPIPRAVGLLALGEAHVGLEQFDSAQKAADEALNLQPDGELNAKGRILAGDIQKARRNFEDAAKIYESVSVVIDDENLTPEAMEKAIEAYKQAGMEAEAKRLLNTLQSRYPEYYQRKKP